MKRILAALALIAVMALPGMAKADVNGFYIAPKFLMSIQDTGVISRPYSDMTDESYSQFTLGGALALGYDFWPQQMIPLRAELEFALRGNSEKSWDSRFDGYGASTKGLWNNSTLLLNLYYDIQTDTPFVPYIGAGVGLAFNYTEYTIKQMRRDFTIPAPATTSPTSPGTWVRAWPTTSMRISPWTWATVS